MNMYKIILQRRSIRKFKQKKIPRSILKKMANAARLAPSAANLQFVEVLLVDKKELLSQIFSCTKWAGYLYPAATPGEKERPLAYAVILLNTKRSKSLDLRDVGAFCENFMLAGWFFGVGSCWIVSVDRKALRKILKVPDYYQIDSIIGLGYPGHKPKAVDNSLTVKYWQDGKGNFYVPKRPLKEVARFV